MDNVTTGAGELTTSPPSPQGSADTQWMQLAINLISSKVFPLVMGGFVQGYADTYSRYRALKKKNNLKNTTN